MALRKRGGGSNWGKRRGVVRAVEENGGAADGDDGEAAAAKGDEVEEKGEDEVEGGMAMDYRAFRAKLVASERAAAREDAVEEGEEAAAAAAASERWMYETPLLEKGSVILGGREMKVSFALRQQYFHKCVLLLIHHNSGFSKGIILNRPTALVLPGMEEWGNVWCGGDVEEGGLFRGGAAAMGKPKSERRKPPSLSVTCLHNLTSSEARAASSVVIQSLYHCTMEVASKLVRDGHARHADFCIFVGYAGWCVAARCIAYRRRVQQRRD